MHAVICSRYSDVYMTVYFIVESGAVCYIQLVRVSKRDNAAWGLSLDNVGVCLSAVLIQGSQFSNQ